MIKEKERYKEKERLKKKIKSGRYDRRKDT